MDSVDLEVLRSVVRWLEDGHRVMLATVVQTWGSAPRPVGAMLAVRDDAQFTGSVSGGCIEEDLVERLVAHPPQRPSTVTYGVTDEQSQRFGLPCGGTLQLVVESIGDVDSVRHVLSAIERRRVVGRRLDMASGQATTFVAEDGTLRFDGDSLLTVYGPLWRLLIIGAGQLSRYVAQMAQALDYQVTVCDPRANYADLWEVPGTQLRREMPDDVVAAILPDRRTAIVALTHDPKLDDLALLEALRSEAFYVGALGSRTTNAKRRERLAQFDLTPTQLARLHGPVGLPIGGRTPPEIAIAILAEMTAVRHGTMLGARHGPPASGRDTSTRRQASG